MGFKIINIVIILVLLGIGWSLLEPFFAILFTGFGGIFSFFILRSISRKNTSGLNYPNIASLVISSVGTIINVCLLLLYSIEPIIFGGFSEYQYSLLTLAASLPTIVGLIIELRQNNYGNYGITGPSFLIAFLLSLAILMLGELFRWDYYDEFVVNTVLLSTFSLSVICSLIGVRSAQLYGWNNISVAILLFVLIIASFLPSGGHPPLPLFIITVPLCIILATVWYFTYRARKRESASLQ